ncbi:DUF4265 domain-containing protein [Aquimarina sp. 2201CG1-2-11]|uniref:DUF4265 domain-containing protein n=1 Tax=Aquimarina discodermiae TaxID=3231043 RepID=UPI0034629837
MDHSINRSKVLFVYQEEEEFKIESLWAIKESEYYKIDNIPFFINNIAYEDLINVEKDGEDLYFDALINESGNSTLQLVIFNDSTQKQIGKRFEDLNCDWEGSHLPNYIAINVPKEVNYSHIINVLNKGVNDGFWDYKEACVSNNHKISIS